MRDYLVRFWQRVLKLGKTVDDIAFLKDAGIITQEEYNAIVTQ